MTKPPRTLREQARHLLRDTDGLSTVEYVILLALVAILSIAAWDTFGKSVQQQVIEAEKQMNF